MTAVSRTEPGKFASPAGTVNPFFNAAAAWGASGFCAEQSRLMASDQNGIL